VEARRQIYQRYRTAFAGDELLEMMCEPNWSFSTHCISACTIVRESKVDAAAMIRRLSAELIEARPIWTPMQLQPVFADANTSRTIIRLFRKTC